jgi:catechol 2,3-dioxygenase-like lactoylglutathione lyase family enzyme
MGEDRATRAAEALAEQQLVRVQHEGIVTRHAEKSKDFYVAVLGLEVLPRPAFSSRGYWLGIPDTYPQIHIIEGDAPIPGAAAALSPRSRHTCFEVRDLGVIRERLRRDGIAYSENVGPDGRVQLICNDPDGHTLEFQKADGGD